MLNGRLYNPVIARMLSPDPFVQAPNSLQNYNRYSYVMNNPLSFTDPSGYRYVSKIEKKFADGFDDKKHSSIGGKFFPNPGFSSDTWSMINAAWENTNCGENMIYENGFLAYSIPDSEFEFASKNNTGGEILVLARSQYYKDAKGNPIQRFGVDGEAAYISLPTVFKNARLSNIAGYGEMNEIFGDLKDDGKKVTKASLGIDLNSTNQIQLSQVLTKMKVGDWTTGSEFSFINKKLGTAISEIKRISVNEF